MDAAEVFGGGGMGEICSKFYAHVESRTMYMW